MFFINIMTSHSEVAGHPDGQETLRAIQEHFTWNGDGDDVREYVKTCLLCTSCKVSGVPGKEQQKPRQPCRKMFLLVVTDLLSRWLEAFLITNSKIKKMIYVLETEVFVRYGFSRNIFTDNGPQFTGTKWKRACDK